MTQELHVILDRFSNFMYFRYNGVFICDYINFSYEASILYSKYIIELSRALLVTFRYKPDIKQNSFVWLLMKYEHRKRRRMQDMNEFNSPYRRVSFSVSIIVFEFEECIYQNNECNILNTSFTVLPYVKLLCISQLACGLIIQVELKFHKVLEIKF